MATEIFNATEVSNLYTAKMIYDNTVVHLGGTAEHYQFPVMFSIYFEESNAFNCSIHIRDVSIDLKEYVFGTEINNRSGIVCVRKDPYRNERIASYQGSLLIEKIESDLIYGVIDARLTGAVSETEYIFKVRFVSAINSN